MWAEQKQAPLVPGCAAVFLSRWLPAELLLQSTQSVLLCHRRCRQRTPFIINCVASFIFTFIWCGAVQKGERGEGERRGQRNRPGTLPKHAC